MFCCTRTTRSSTQGQKLSGHDDGQPALLEVARMAGDDLVSLTPGGGHRLNRIFEIAPAKGRGLLQNGVVNGFDAKQAGEVDLQCSGFVLPHVLKPGARKRMLDELKTSG